MAETFSLDFIDSSDNLNLWEEIKNRLELEEEIAEIVGRSLLEKIPKGKKSRQTILKGINFAIKHHGEQKRKSGEPYFFHPIAVAEIIADYKLDVDTILTALLHDVIEDTAVSKEQIEEEFGRDVANMVEGVTKLTQIKFKSYHQKQAENFRKFIIAISEDIRVLIVKLADRLHNVKTLHHIDNIEKKRRIALETMEIYAPLAERIGMQRIKDEFQNIAFKILNPEGFKSIKSRLEFLRNEGMVITEGISSELTNVIKSKTEIEANVFGREKRPYSIWRKMQKKKVAFEQLSDIIGFRVIVKTEEECYKALFAIHTKYHSISENFKDYISTPKTNGYRSLHTVIIGPKQNKIEVQIRTQEMQRVAEIGVAAHWSYKQNKIYNNLEGRQYKWIKELLDIIETATEPEEFLEHTKLQMYHDTVFCFSPKGDLIPLPKGATAVDFAFAVHSDVGLRCVGARVNGQIVPLRKPLENGDQIDILQAKQKAPSASWESFVKTGRARGLIRRYFRQKHFDDLEKFGRKIIENEFLSHSKIMSSEDIGQCAVQLGLENARELFIKIGNREIDYKKICRDFFNIGLQEKPNKKNYFVEKSKPNLSVEKTSSPIIGVPVGVQVKFMECCFPLPGENIIGIKNGKTELRIHRAGCLNLEEFMEKPEKWQDVKWHVKAEEMQFYTSRIKAEIYHKPGALSIVANEIGKQNVNISNIRISEKSSDFYQFIVDLELRSLLQLKEIMKTMLENELVYSVMRR